jgi:hypothetical protein
MNCTCGFSVSVVMRRSGAPLMPACQPTEYA